MARLAALLASFVGVVVGAAYVSPLLIAISPWLAAAVALVGVIVIGWLEARAREEKLNREVLGRWLPQRSAPPGAGPPGRGGQPGSPG